MDEQQVDIIRLKFAERLVDAGLRPLVAGIGNPYFGDDEQFIAGHSAATDSIAHILLVEVGLSRIYHPITYADGIPYAPLAFRR